MPAGTARRISAALTSFVVVAALAAIEPGRLESNASPQEAPAIAALPGVHAAAIAGAIGVLLDDAADAEFGQAASASEQQELKALYAPTGSSSLWITDRRRLAPDAHVAIALLGQADDHGLNPEDYRLRGIEELAAAVDGPAPVPIASIARLDVGISLALLRFYRHLHLGRVDPRTLAFHIDAPAHTDDFVEIVRAARAGGRMLEAAVALTCPLAQYESLRGALRQYRSLVASGAAGSPTAETPVVHPGDAYPQLASLRRLLVAVGDLGIEAPEPGPESVYAEPFVSAVVRFQKRHGLDPDGVLGRRTQAALAVPIGWRVRQIELALERLRWLPDLGTSRLIAVNIPMFRLWAWDATGRSPSLSTNVVVGRAVNTETPVFMAQMRHVIFRAYWNVPVSIARGELLPALARDPDRLVRDRFEIVGGGDDSPVLPLTENTLAHVRRGTLRLRQRPGPGNALGLVKFVFPNDHDVYMHDTPSHALFGRSRRDFSHGCIRVEHPAALAEWALGDAQAWSGAQVSAAMHGADNRRVDLPQPVQVVLFYLTAAVMPEDGSVHFAEDIYRHDARLDRALGTRP